MSVYVLPQVIVINEILVPIFTKIDENKMYIESTVDECVSNINTFAWVIGSYSSFTCNLKETGTVQIDDTKLF